VVTASAFDLALHDAYGKLAGKSVYHCYGQDLGDFLGPEFKGETLERYVLPSPSPSLSLYHTVGALDALEPAQIAAPIKDGLPECLSQWIARDGSHHFKVKLNGNNMDWDIQRLMEVQRVAALQLKGRRATYSLDFNETCPGPDYLMGFIRHFESKHPAILAEVQLFEQPTHRSMKPGPGMHYGAAALIKPVVADEALVDMQSLFDCVELGYNGVALKACKGQTLALLMGAYAQKKKMFVCVMDLTCPGQAFLESAALAAHVPGVTAFEANARQYLPASAQEPWNARYPEAFEVKAGQFNTGRLGGPGLGF
jgi:L-alanine-DL-glutamate epimerase-like enolase superfamily enzyme